MMITIEIRRWFISTFHENFKLLLIKIIFGVANKIDHSNTIIKSVIGIKNFNELYATKSHLKS
ncbi:hypothetical protein [Lutibacter sp.]